MSKSALGASAILACLILGSPAMADDNSGPALPTYDIGDICATSVVAPGRLWLNKTEELAAMKDCVAREQKNYDHLKALWPIAPNKARTVSLARCAGKLGSYTCLSDLDDLSAYYLRVGPDGDLTLPIYEVDAYCRNWITRPQAGGSSDPKARQDQINECVRSEQAIYDGLKFRWPDILAVTKTRCITRNARTTEYRYTQLENCINVFSDFDKRQAEKGAPPASFKP